MTGHDTLPLNRAVSSDDAITHEVLTGKILAAVDEMAIVLARASMSSVVYEVLDFACGLCDARGEPSRRPMGLRFSRAPSRARCAL